MICYWSIVDLNQKFKICGKLQDVVNYLIIQDAGNYLINK